MRKQDSVDSPHFQGRVRCFKVRRGADFRQSEVKIGPAEGFDQQLRGGGTLIRTDKVEKAG